MFKAGVHYGHKTKYWNPQMRDYIYTKRNDLHIINLDKTATCLSDALNYLGSIAKSSNKILFVGTKRAASKIIAREASRCQMPYVDHRWLGGMLTNYKTVSESIKRLINLEADKQLGKFEGMIKKEGLNLERELLKLQQSLGGIKHMVGLPDAIFIIDVGFENIAVKEANKLSIPVIGVVDTNNSPEGINYVIPGNDDASKSIELYAKAVADTIIASKAAAAQYKPSPAVPAQTADAAVDSKETTPTKNKEDAS